MKVYDVIYGDNIKLGNGVKVWHFSQIRENVEIGDNTIIGKSVYIDKDVKIGKNCKIQNNVSVYYGVTIEDNVFVGPHVCFTNDKYPRATDLAGNLLSEKDWKLSPTLIKRFASIGANSTILCGIIIGEGAFIGAGSVVTKDVPAGETWVGNPARRIEHRRD